MPEHTWTVMTLSLEALDETASWIDDKNGDLPTPCRDWTVTQVFQHAVADQLVWASILGVGEGPTDDPFAPSGHLDGNVADSLEPALAAAGAAWAGVKSSDDVVPTPLPQGALAAPIAAAACALDAAVHAWDIAVALRRPSPLANPLAAELVPAARAIVEPLRGYGAFGAALTAEPEDDAVAELLCYLGRDPRWSAGS